MLQITVNTFSRVPLVKARSSYHTDRRHTLNLLGGESYFPRKEAREALALDKFRGSAAPQGELNPGSPVFLGAFIRP